MAASFGLLHICCSPSMLQGMCATHACRRHAKKLCTDTPESDRCILREVREPTNVMAQSNVIARRPIASSSCLYEVDCVVPAFTTGSEALPHKCSLYALMQDLSPSLLLCHTLCWSLLSPLRVCCVISEPRDCDILVSFLLLHSSRAASVSGCGQAEVQVSHEQWLWTMRHTWPCRLPFASNDAGTSLLGHAALMSAVWRGRFDSPLLA